ncbi:MAG: hypothetical protein FWH55_00630 [Oscillospiraceae bacterium]|nr:hypothetical protein [Oscillospiraceae bacterium]
MVTSSGIKEMSATAADYKNAVIRKHSPYNEYALKLSSEWKGDIVGAFKDMNRRVGSRMQEILRVYGDINSKLTNLSRSCKKAEDEEDKKKAQL